MPENKPKPLAHNTAEHWCKQECEAARGWVAHRIDNPDQLEAYSVGVDHGFRKALALLSLHGYLRFTY